MVPPTYTRAQQEFEPQLHITTSEIINVTFTVAYNSRSHRLPAFSHSFIASKGSVTKVNLPIMLRANTTSPSNFDIAVNVKADGNKTIVVYLLNEGPASTDIALLYPKFATETGTYTYYAVCSPSTSGGLGVEDRSFVGIIATENDCVIEVTPTAVALGIVAGHRQNNPGVVARSQPLPKSTVIFLSSVDDLTGTKVTGTCYLSVITGHQCAFYPADVQSCDGIMEQIPPTETWGFNFFLSPLAKRQSAGYRFIAGADNTVVTRRCNGSEPDTFTLAQGGHFREVLVNVPTYCHVESTQPLLVAQYSLGHQFGGSYDLFADPFVTLIAPVGQFNNKYNFILVESVTPQNVPQPVVFDPYLNLVVTNDCCQHGEILYDGQPIPSSVPFTDIACAGGEVCGCASQFHLSVSTGAHTLMHIRDSCGIGATLYAWQNMSSYSSLAGTRLESIAGTDLLPWNVSIHYYDQQ